MKLIFLFFVLTISGFAQAQETFIPPECRILPDHRAQANVSYQAGVDVNGKPVVPADVNSPQIALPKTIIVPLTIDLAKRLQGSNIPGLNLEGTLGFLEIGSDGRVNYDGRDITPQVYVLCGREGADEPENKPDTAPSEPNAPDGQKAIDVIKSKPE